MVFRFWIFPLFSKRGPAFGKGLMLIHKKYLLLSPSNSKAGSSSLLNICLFFMYTTLSKVDSDFKHLGFSEIFCHNDMRWRLSFIRYSKLFCSRINTFLSKITCWHVLSFMSLDVLPLSIFLFYVIMAPKQ